jgi:hypothetical protein
MSDNEEQKTEKPNPLTKSHQKILDAACSIWGEGATAKDAAYMARELVQCTLPHRNPGAVPTWSRRNGSLVLTIQAGYKLDHKTGNRVFIGHPYGTIPRLLLFWMVSEAIRTKSPRLELGNSLNEFMEELGLSSYTGRGKRGDATRLKNQMERLFNAFISFEGQITKDGRTGNARLNMAVAEKTVFWWSDKLPEHSTLFNNYIELGQRFFEAITAAPVPVDMRALRALKQSPLALDLYVWLTYTAFRAHKSGEPIFVSWEQLHNQMGGDYSDIEDFRKKGVKQALAKIMVVYPKLKLGKRLGGIEVLPESLPALQPRGETIEGRATRVPTPEPVTPAVTSPPAGKHLTPATIEKFRFRFPRFDVYACEADFRHWLETKASEQPRNFQSAFLGFAEKWTANKI